MARVLLDLRFPPSLRGELCEAVGLELDPTETGQLSAARRGRDRRMRELVLTVYEYQCPCCGYDGRIGTVSVGLEAAHVRWWAFGGPDNVENGLCLARCTKRFFDKGALGIGDDYRILVSQRFAGHGRAAREHVIALAGLRQVFHGSPRPAATA